MDRYIGRFTYESPFKRFIDDYKTHTWDKEMKKLIRELQAVTDLQAISNSEIHTNNISSPAENTVLKRLKLEHEIARRATYKRIFDTALNNLTDDEREIFEGFHLPKCAVSRFVDEYSHEHDCSTRHTYRLKIESEKAFCEEVMAQKGNYPTFV